MRSIICQDVLLTELLQYRRQGHPQIIESRIGIDELIKFKHSQKIELSDTEINYLVGKLR